MVEQVTATTRTLSVQKGAACPYGSRAFFMLRCDM
jgi:hypothetical protein